MKFSQEVDTCPGKTGGKDVGGAFFVEGGFRLERKREACYAAK